MNDEFQSVAELIRELEALRSELAELKAVSAERDLWEADLRENEERYRQLVDTMPDAVVVHREGIVLFANRAAAHMIGAEAADQLIGRPILPFIHPDDRERVLQRIRQALEGVGLPIVDHRLIRFDGALVEAETHPTRVSFGGALAVQSILRDVTKMTRAERSVRALLDATLEATFLIEPNGTILAANQALAQALGRTEAELVGLDIYTLLKPDLAESRRAYNDEVVRTGQPVQYEDERDGRYFSHSIYPVTDNRGRVTALAIYAHDITGLKRTEQALRESEERYRLLAEHTRDVIWTLDADYRFNYISPSIRYLRGLEPEEAMRESIEETMTPESFRKVQEVIARRSDQAARGEAYEVDYIEIQQYHQDGSLVWVEVAAQPIWDAMRRLAGVRGVSRDITERKKLEAQLLQSQKLEAIGRLAGGVAHDFNNILTVIRGSTEFLLDSTPADDPSRGDLESIQRAGDRAADLTRQLLAFSGRQILQPRVMNPNLLVSGIARMLRRLVGEDVELSLDLAPDIAPVLLDPGQIEQVILNLVINAREAMPDGGQLTIGSANVMLNEQEALAFSKLGAGAYVELSVRDTGIGLDAETRAHIFDPFFTTKEMGYGLGLATVYGIVAQSGGTITVESTPGAGTTFRVYLPALNQSAPRQAAPTVEETPRGGHEAVLVVEDEEGVLNMICRALREKGYTVFPAAHGEEALQILRERPGAIQLVLTDVVMPGRANGRQMVEALQALSPGLKVLFMSGYPGETIAHHHVLDDGLSFIAKPFTMAALLRKMRDVLDE
ncbi:MAG: PAS domain S-box protein [Planctomycetes bacterium]|nr:PAS domain S-box protein [Planctomycetota bacterium]